MMGSVSAFTIWNFGSGNLQERFLAIYVAAQAAIKEM